MFWVRIDNRLVHGQIIESWIPYTGADAIVVANDDLATDILRQEIMSLAIPQSMLTQFLTIEQLPAALKRWSPAERADAIVLFSSCPDAKRAFETGFVFDSLNVGNLHYGPGKRQLSPSIAVSDEDESCLRYFAGLGIDLDFRCVPNDPIQVRFK